MKWGVLLVSEKAFNAPQYLYWAAMNRESSICFAVKEEGKTLTFIQHMLWARDNDIPLGKFYQLDIKQVFFYLLWRSLPRRSEEPVLEVFRNWEYQGPLQHGSGVKLQIGRLAGSLFKEHLNTQISPSCAAK